MNYPGFVIVVVLLVLLPQSLMANNTAESAMRLLVLGDSLAAGYGLPAAEAFPAQLEKALRDSGCPVRVINAGVSGDTTAGGLSRLDWALADSPAMVLVELGANDAMRGLPVAATRNNLDLILQKLAGTGIKVVLAGMKAPRNMGQPYVDEFDYIYPALAKKYNVTLYPFFLDGVALDPALNQPDGIHPNAAGVKIVVNKILPYIISEINRSSKQKPPFACVLE